jgi:hypothetical protein
MRAASIPVVPVALLSCAVLFGSTVFHAATLSHIEQTAQGDFSRRPKPTGTRVETRHLTVTTSTSADAASPADELALYVDVEPKPKMHVYTPEQKDVISVAFLLDPNESIRAGAVRYPRSEKYYFEPLNETQLVYSKPFLLAHNVTLARTTAVRQRASAAGATLTIKGTLRYQACDDAICYMPQDVPISWTVALNP